jgi:hypothetical protein
MDVPPEPPASYEYKIHEELVGCGLASSGISITYQEDWQSYEIVIAEDAGASVENFLCIRNASRGEIVTFSDAKTYREYLDFVSELSRPEVLRRAQEALAEQGRLQGFPSRSAYDSDKHFAEALEMHCGLEPGSAIRYFGATLAFMPPIEEARDYRAFSKKYSCLLSAIALVGAKQELDVGMIGNEAVAPE